MVPSIVSSGNSKDLKCVIVVVVRRLCQLIRMCSTSPSRYLRIAEQ